MSRPLLAINEDEVMKLASYGCTQGEIADFFGCDQTTISRRFASAFDLGRANMKISIRKLQLRRARKGSDTMLIHLGKHYCGQTDRLDVTTAGQPIQVTFERIDNPRDHGISPPTEATEGA
jgi:hypothetical protein